MKYLARVFLAVLMANICQAAPQEIPKYLKLGFEVAERFRDAQDPMRLVKRSEILEYPEKFSNGRFLKKRTTESDISLENSQETAYLMTFYMGTPPKEFHGQLDTGSSDLWLYSNINKACKSMNCSDYGEYDPNESSTFKDTGTNFRIGYLDTTQAKGPVYEDVMTIGDNVFEFEKFTFGLGTEANSSTPVFGIGLQNCESFDIDYSNFPMRLFQDGYINRVSYSLFLDSVNSTTGTFLAGAVDTEQFDGNLTMCPVINAGEGAPSAFFVTSNGISIVTNSQSSSDSDGNSDSNTVYISTIRHPILLDSGTSFFIVTETMYDNIGAAIPGLANDDYLGYHGQCTLIEDRNLNVDFCGETISVPLSFLAMSVEQAYAKGIFGLSKKDVAKMNGECILLISSTPGTQIIAGDALMRYLYVYFDLDTLELGIGRANFNSASEDIVMVESGTDFPISATAGSLYTATYAGDLNTPSPEDGTETTLSSAKATTTDNANNKNVNDISSAASSPSSATSSSSINVSSIDHSNSSSGAGSYKHDPSEIPKYLLLLLSTLIFIL